MWSCRERIIEPLKADVEKLKEAKVEAKKVEVTERKNGIEESVEELSAKFDAMEEKANKSMKPSQNLLRNSNRKKNHSKRI